MYRKKTFSTWDSRVIPHLTTSHARSDLASQFEMGWGACHLGMAERDYQNRILRYMKAFYWNDVLPWTSAQLHSCNPLQSLTNLSTHLKTILLSKLHLYFFICLAFINAKQCRCIRRPQPKMNDACAVIRARHNRKRGTTRHAVHAVQRVHDNSLVAPNPINSVAHLIRGPTWCTAISVWSPNICWQITRVRDVCHSNNRCGRMVVQSPLPHWNTIKNRLLCVKSEMLCDYNTWITGKRKQE